MKVRYQAKGFEIPPEGVEWASIVEIKELGLVETPNGAREKIAIVWELDRADGHGRSFLVFQRFNLSLHPASFLSKTIHDITGEEVGDEFELDELISSRRQLVLKHNQSESNGRTYANIAAILRPKTAAEEAEEKLVTAATVRVKQGASINPFKVAPRTALPVRGAVALSADENGVEITNNDVPF